MSKIKVAQSNYPLVSVVMCAYNTRSFIENAVNSILKQTYLNFELIISDDGSTDGTREWLSTLKDHPKVRLFLQERNMGYVANKNFAISQAKGEFITQNDSDDVSCFSRLEKQVQVCLKNPKIKIVASGYNKIDSRGNIFATIAPSADILYKGYSGEPYEFWFPPLMVHKDVYKEKGLFTNYFSGMGDDLYWTVKANENFDIFCLRDALYSYRDNPDSITNVLDNTRKLIVIEMLNKVLKQRSLSGTDWLEQKNFTALEAMEVSLLKNKRFMADQYRVWAAKSIDKRDRKQALSLLGKCFKLNPFYLKNFSTLGYFIRTFIV
ncbi:glycosyltransferase family 2 protein [Rufibacter glacialis]|uniref:Glycosyltransferase family 2 protein n=1 Tax=Rufibacter glacialis TaxID=1259555 RepID=A0A5M8QNF0_9BACT|nr:glycosyltransferase family A protein [Rufibacter glacialis]KAA6437609.1 glycosyltransferase family 2 protein [Rufibacter glacialis]GGK57855.1 hypothetical protein GCM10011405_02420 [Rufibacter glacialis]